MSDYLGHLLERSFTPAPEVRPRIPSFFESNTNSGQSVLRFDSAETDYQTTPENVSYAAAGERKNRQQTISTRDDRSRIPAPESISAPMDKTNSEQAHSAKTAADFSVPQVPREVENAEQSRSTQGSQPVRDHIHPSQRRYEERRPPAEPSQSRRPLAPAQNLQPHEEPIVPRDTTPSHAPKTVAVLPLSVARAREKSSTRNETPAAQNVPATPSIQVSIGRVEIRANRPSALPARPAPRKESGLSLESYLQRRAGGQS